MSYFSCRVLNRCKLLFPTFFLSFSVYAFSQDSLQVNIQAKNMSLEAIFKQIESQTGFTFYYDESVLNGDKLISVSLPRTRLVTAMNEILKNENVAWRTIGKAIIIFQRKEPEENILAADTLPTFTLKGRVTDVEGKPLMGVTVQVKGTQQGTSTDTEGVFAVKNLTENTTLIIRSIGFEMKQVKVSGSDIMNIVLKHSIKEINPVEILSTGYQEISKERATGSFVQLDNAIINRKVSTNIFDRITEITSGLNFNPRSINGGSNSIQIRGVSTLTSNTMPLIVVDGFAYDNTNSQSLFDIYNYLNNINPNDVESITVLKDAAAASIWGARSGNGVIVINTNKGRYQQKARIRFTTNVNIAEKPRLSEMPLISSTETVEFEKSLFARDFYRSSENAGSNFRQYSRLIPPVYELLIAERDGFLSPSEARKRIAAYEQNDVRSDISKYFLQHSINQQYAVNVSGGSANYIYYASLGYDRNRREEIGNVDSRFTLRLDNTFRPFRRFEINAYTVFTQTNMKNNGLPYQHFFGPARPVYNMLADENGNALPVATDLRTYFTANPGNPDYLDWQYRPLDEIRRSDNVTGQVNIRMGGILKYDIIKGLSIEMRGLYEKGSTNRRVQHTLESYTARNLINQFMFRDATGLLQYPVPLNGILDNQTTDLQIWNTRAQVNFNRRFNTHMVNILMGAEMREARSNYDSYRKYGYDVENSTFNNRPDYVTQYQINPARASVQRVPSVDDLGGVLNRFRSYYANLMYTYKDNYTFTSSIRQDGANLFGVKANDRVVPLWSAGVLWDISGEPFYSLSYLPVLKFRGSYGFNGNIKNEATTYATINYSSSPSFLSRLPWAGILTPPNPSLRWERVQIINAGIDFSTKESRITGTIEYYQKRGLDLINSIPTDPTIYINNAGSSSYIGNGASIKGRGVDVTLNTINLSKGSFSWHTNILFSYNEEKVTSLGHDQQTSSSGGANYVYEGLGILVGKPLYALYSFPWAGLNPNNGDPMGYVKGSVVPYTTVLSSVSSLPNTQPSDMVYHGQANPKFFGAIRNTVLYRQWSLSANILYKFGHYFRRPTISYSILYANFNGHSDYSLRWKKPGDELVTNVPSLPPSGNTDRDLFYQNSEIMVEKADHIRLQDIRIAYTLSKGNKEHFPFQEVSLYVYLNNIGVLWTDNKQRLDPEWDRAYLNIPPSRTLAVGMAINF